MARRVSVEDPPAELHTSLPEQIPPEMQKKLPEQSKKLLDKPSRQLLLEGLDPIRPSDETQQGHPVRKTSRKQPQGGSRGFKMESLLEMSKAEGIEASSTQTQDLRGLEEKVLNVRVRKNMHACIHMHAQSISKYRIDYFTLNQTFEFLLISDLIIL